MENKMMKSLIKNIKKHIACGCIYKLISVDDKFSKSYLGEDAVYNYIDSMIRKSKFCTDIMKKHFNEELAMTREDDKGFKKPYLLNVGFVIMFVLRVMLKLEIIVISLKNIVALHIKNVISKLN